ncbi:unnamed protein product [Spirodela intermedia]|uniref:Uncharacterized protein n=1 Tax=Spirodela intermedia TaxID=51605 RepID=A0A7I8KVA3_SPIIN|nr:unnamed protein product [Spirodela intermedia]
MAFMVGLFLGELLRQRAASAATLCAPLVEYCPSRLGSIMRENLRGSFSHGRAHSTRFCSLLGLLLSTDRRPESSSSSTTPKL